MVARAPNGIPAAVPPGGTPAGRGELPLPPGGTVPPPTGLLTDGQGTGRGLHTPLPRLPWPSGQAPVVRP